MSTRVAGFRCAVCGALVDIATPLSWRCPNATDADRHHVLQIVGGGPEGGPVGSGPVGSAPVGSAPAGSGVDHPNPFVSFRSALAWDAFAAAARMTEAARIALIEETDAAIASVAGTGFRWTPFARADALSRALGFTDAGGVWIKDETGNVAGSHKARHLFTILLHLLTAERMRSASWTGRAGTAGVGRPPLAIASCGNAALAAATLAAATTWPIKVFVPLAANESIVSRLAALGAEIVVCPRRDTDPPGDPCVHRFREAVAAGAVPFSVQGPENAWCLDGGRTIGWELLAQAESSIGGERPLDRVIVQVGGGAFAACIGAAISRPALSGAASSGAGQGRAPILHAVQTEGCAPLSRAWERAGDAAGRAAAAGHWSALMWPWETEPRSAADGILDDETYDWLGVFDGMLATGGWPIVAPESTVIEAARLAAEHTSIDASATGTAGLAGLLTIRDEITPDERVAVVFSGIRR
ncbi:MAG: PLP-dependent lyase/thiolase [Acidimicrobiia bacterium]